MITSLKYDFGVIYVLQCLLCQYISSLRTVWWVYRVGVMKKQRNNRKRNNMEDDDSSQSVPDNQAAPTLEWQTVVWWCGRSRRCCKEKRKHLPVTDSWDLAVENGAIFLETSTLTPGWKCMSDPRAERDPRANFGISCGLVMVDPCHERRW